jgi:transposase
MATNNSFFPLALRPRDAAKALGISPRLLWQLTHDGHVPCVRVGSGKCRTVLYPTAVLQAWLSRHSAKPKRRGDVFNENLQKSNRNQARPTVVHAPRG